MFVLSKRGTPSERRPVKIYLSCPGSLKIEKQLPHMTLLVDSRNDLSDELGRTDYHQILVPPLPILEWYGLQDEDIVNGTVLKQRIYPTDGVWGEVVMNDEEADCLSAMMLGDLSAGL